MSTLKTEVISISFDGIEQMSDGFLFSLFHCKLNLSTVKWISLTGNSFVAQENIFYVLTRMIIVCKNCQIQDKICCFCQIFRKNAK
jgi:hypothetical protein